MALMTTPAQDAYYQYSDGMKLLSETLVEREQLLRELEHLAKAPQGKSSAEIIPRFNVVRAQLLLFDLSVIAEKIDMLVIQINTYADQCGQPRVEITPPEL
ncbi:MAG TPA: hypothetical protein VF918_04770 [Anaerolineales bacterium]